MLKIAKWILMTIAWILVATAVAGVIALLACFMWFLFKLIILRPH